MTKSTNDNMMTRPQATPITPPAYGHGLGDGSPEWGPGVYPRYSRVSALELITHRCRTGSHGYR